MYACARALVWGEDFTSDPVSKAVGYALQYFSGGTLTINVPLMSQVSTASPGNEDRPSRLVSPASNFACCHGVLFSVCPCHDSWRVDPHPQHRMTFAILCKVLPSSDDA